jgi:hypothetical protein
MATRKEQLEAKLAKLKAELAKAEEEVLSATQSDAAAAEVAKKLTEASEAIRQLMAGIGIDIPESKVITIEQVMVKTEGQPDTKSYKVEVVDKAGQRTPRARKAAAEGGNGTGKVTGGAAGKITLADGSVTSWSALCQSEGLEVGGDSAHRVFAKQRPDMHKTIPHICTLDGKTYPEAAAA